MRHLVVLGVLAVVLGSALSLWAEDKKAGAEAKWTTDYKAALGQATKDKKPVFLFFTGSDWCGFCKKFMAEVGTTPEFVDWAGKNVILVELDFPRDKSKQTDELKKQNADMGKQFTIKGYPTMVLVDGGGKELGRTVGFAPGTKPADWIAAFEKATGMKKAETK